MAQHFEILRKYFKMINRVERGDYPNTKQLLAAYDVDDEVSSRTLSRYRTELREEFGIDIGFNAAKGGYQIAKDEDYTVDQFLKFVEFSTKAELAADIFKHGKKAMKVLQFEEHGLLKGLEYLQPLFKAVRNQSVVEIEYFKFESDEIHRHTIYPYLLKEYQGRWYAVSYCVDKDDTRTFSVDRIQSLLVTEKNFKTKPKFHKLELLDHCIGLNWSSEKIERIVIRFTEYQAKYQRALPWHESQKELDTAPKGFIDFEFRLIVNYELQQKIWMLGKEVEVLEPGRFKG